MIETPICIIGAGPAGAATALQLNQYGIPCVVVDKAVFPRDKVCGDGLSGKVLLALNRIDKNIVERLSRYEPALESWGVTFTSPARTSVDIPYKKEYDKASENLPAGFVCKRIDFDHFLVDEIKRCSNIRLIEGQSIDKYELTQDGYLLRDKEGKCTIKAQLIIVANGAHSGFAKDVAGMQMEPEHFSAGVRAYYSNVQGMHGDGYIELQFLKQLLPGYFWIFPLPGGGANVGLGMLSAVVRKKKLNLKKMLQETIENDPVMKERFRDATLETSIDGYGLPLGCKQRPVSGERYMLVGDAASLIDPFTGEGIGNAMYSGRAAAEQAAAALAANDFSARQLKAYDEQVYRVLGPELKLSAKLLRLVHRPWLFNFILRTAMRNKQLKELMTSMFYEVDIRKKLTQPSFYLKLLLNRA